jgi:hypothetical protein
MFSPGLLRLGFHPVRLFHFLQKATAQAPIRL